MEFTSKPDTRVREGTVGDMYSTDTKEHLPGGGHQVEFKDYPGKSLDKFEINLESLKDVELLK